MSQIIDLKEINNTGNFIYSFEKEPIKNDIKNSEEVEPLQKVNSPCLSQCARYCSNMFTLNTLKRKLPILVWLPAYCLEDFKGDLIAGMTVALTVIPQGLALASLANLPPQFGLYTAFMGCFMYAIFGSCKNLTIGPTAIMSLMTAEHASKGGLTYVILITFLSGCIQLIMGVLNLGFLMTFISASVVTGFTSAAAITIATTQISGIFGIQTKSEGFLEDVYHFFLGIKNGEIRYYDMTLGLSSIAILFFLKYINQIKSACCCSGGIIIDTLFRLISTARNALLVLMCACTAALLLSYDIDVLTLTKTVKPGLPPFEWPSFSYSYINNATNVTIHKDFFEIVQDMGSGLIVLPLLCLLEAIAIAKSFAKGKKIDATQEMIAIGISNIMGSFVSSYPATGSFSRTAINYSSGVRTTAGGIVTGSLVLLALGVMSPYFRFIPKASLSALIFISVLHMVHYEDIVIMWRTNKLDLLPFTVTFILSFVLGLEYGIILGIAVSMLLLLLQESRPNVIIEERKTYLGINYLYVKPDRTILFPAAEKLQTKIIRAIPDKPESHLYFVLIDGEHLTTADYTTSMVLKTLNDDFKDNNINMVFINLKPEVQSAILRSGIKSFKHFNCKADVENFINDLSVSHTSPLIYENNLPRYSIRSDDVSFDGS